jgi:hypothetical protein
MITLKIQKKDELSYLLGLESVDFEDINKQDAVITVKIGETKLHLMKVNVPRDEFVENLKKLAGLDESSIIVKS